MLLIEFFPFVRWRPKFERFGNEEVRCWRFMWGGFGIYYMPYDFNGLMRATSNAAVQMFQEGRYPFKDDIRTIEDAKSYH
jgi:hypothetical protein